MAVYESVYYGVLGLAVLAVLLITYLLYASVAVFTSHNAIFKSFMYITAILDSAFIGYAVRGITCAYDQEEVADSVAKAKLELIAADTEIMHREMLSSLDSLIDLVHMHIKIAQKHLDNVRR